jgi:hypothetical protein
MFVICIVGILSENITGQQSGRFLGGAIDQSETLTSIGTLYNRRLIVDGIL